MLLTFPKNSEEPGLSAPPDSATEARGTRATPPLKTPHHGITTLQPPLAFSAERVSAHRGVQADFRGLSCIENHGRDLGVASSIIQEDLTINGDISSTEGSVEIKGTVIGDLTAQSIIVQEGGSTNGTLSAKSVAVEGGHCGQLQCDDLKLASTARVKADVSAHSMSTESGAKIEGTVKITGKS